MTFWTRLTEQPAGMGIRFRFTDPSERLQLESFVGKLMSEKLGGHVAAMLLGKESKT